MSELACYNWLTPREIYNGNYDVEPAENFAAQTKEVVTAYYSAELLLPFGFCCIC